MRNAMTKSRVGAAIETIDDVRRAGCLDECDDVRVALESLRQCQATVAEIEASVAAATAERNQSDGLARRVAARRLDELLEQELQAQVKLQDAGRRVSEARATAFESVEPILRAAHASHYPDVADAVRNLRDVGEALQSVERLSGNFEIERGSYGPRLRPIVGADLGSYLVLTAESLAARLRNLSGITS